MITRLLLLVAAMLLTGTAGFHATGLSMVSGWLPGERGEILSMLWLTPVIDWIVVAIVWFCTALRMTRAWALPAAIVAIIPGAAAIGLFSVVGLAHPGPIMLGVATLLALWGAWRLRDA